ncbi:MAG: hypothetical protein ACFFFC_20495 [Candidatus Thorarchaeota archaeon]
MGKTFDIHTDKNESLFARSMWDVAAELRRDIANGPMKSFKDESVFLHWRNAIRIIIRDANKRSLEKSGLTISAKGYEQVIDEVLKVWKAAL